MFKFFKKPAPAPAPAPELAYPAPEPAPEAAQPEDRLTRALRLSAQKARGLEEAWAEARAGKEEANDLLNRMETRAQQGREVGEYLSRLEEDELRLVEFQQQVEAEMAFARQFEMEVEAELEALLNRF
jgi:hypothetical protein